MTPGQHREFVERNAAHFALHGWELVYGGWGSVGLYNLERGTGVGVVYRNTIRDPDGDDIGAVTALGNQFKAPVDWVNVPVDMFHKLILYTGVVPI